MVEGLTFGPKRVDKDNCERHCVLTPFANTFASALARSAFTLEMVMMKPRMTLTRRSVFRAGAGLAIATATPVFTPPQRRRKASVKPARTR